MLDKAPKALTADSDTAAKNGPYSLGNSATLEAKRPETKTGRKLEWQQVNTVTWRLVDPDASELRLEASHGQWGGYQYPKALAYVFDVGVFDHDWRIRVRLRGNRWRALGCVIDVATAKHIAQQAVENPSEPKPSKFNIPLNLLGGDRRAADAPMLDPQTCGYLRRVEIGAVKVEATNANAETVPCATDDDSINVSATDEIARRDRWEKTTRELASLPQLFIAV